MDLQNLLKQAQKMQGSIKKIEEELTESEYTGTAGGNGVTVTIKGTFEITNINIEEDLLEKDNKEMLQDLIMVAVNQAVETASKDRDEKMGAVTAGVKMPGMF
ncbi:YbaB/EbfC family nucleoid-associated protein [Anaerorhabdus sp.]|jgi:nucleoid-associated protein EbfC|uniref:YbaB/EbfC family nucleoid-associated protein n=1 Tax=Anaerorhabdus sp. TaxID=1872524 RepID=UPI002FC6883A